MRFTAAQMDRLQSLRDAQFRDDVLDELRVRCRSLPRPPSEEALRRAVEDGAAAARRHGLDDPGAVFHAIELALLDPDGLASYAAREVLAEAAAARPAERRAILQQEVRRLVAEGAS